MAKLPREQYDNKEAQQRLQKALRAALNTPPKPRAKPKTQKAKKRPAK